MIVSEGDPIDDADIRDALPVELDPSALVGPYLFPNNSRRRIPAVLYTLIAGRPPVEGSSHMVLLSKVASGELVPLSNAAPGAPVDPARVEIDSLGPADPVQDRQIVDAVAGDVLAQGERVALVGEQRCGGGQ